MPAKVKKVWDAVTTTLVILVALVAILLVGARIFGLQVYSVMSGSMEPEYPVGSLIYVRTVDYKTLQPRDVITYRLNKTTISTHRIVQVLTKDGYRFITKGDANDDPDGAPVQAADVIGTPVAAIPLLGYVAFYIQRPPGLYIAIAAGAILAMMVFLPDLLCKEPARSETPDADDASKISI